MVEPVACAGVADCAAASGACASSDIRRTALSICIPQLRFRPQHARTVDGRAAVCTSRSHAEEGGGRHHEADHDHDAADDGRNPHLAGLRVGQADSLGHQHRALFALARAEIAGEAHRVVAEFHPQYGLPTSVSVDFVRRMVDDEIAYTVTDFQSLR